MKLMDIKNYIICSAILITVLGFILSSCADQDEIYVAPPPPGGCDTVNVTYSKTIQKILSDNCTNCHNSSNTSGGVNIAGYENVKINVDNGKLLKSITPGGSMVTLLSDCNAKQIIAWINKGAANN